MKNSAKIVKWDSIQPVAKNSNSDSDKKRSDLSKWVNWRIKLNDELLTKQTSLNSLQIEKNISVNDYMNKDLNMRDFIIYGLPKVNLSTEYIQKHRPKDLVIPKHKLKTINDESISNISTIRLNKIPGINVREKIKEFEKVANSINFDISTKSKISSCDNKNQQSRSYSISSYSTATTGINRESSTASSNKSCTTSTFLTTSNFTTSDLYSTISGKKKLNFDETKEKKEPKEHIYYNDNEKPPPKPNRKIPLSKLSSLT